MITIRWKYTNDGLDSNNYNNNSDNNSSTNDDELRGSDYNADIDVSNDKIKRQIKGL